jgi:cobalt-zinc-cadmium efflux system protein
MTWTGWHLIDPILSLGVVAIILRGAVRVLRESAHILLEGTPRDIEVGEIERVLLGVPGIRSVHHLHIWSLCSEYYALSAHVLVDDQPMSAASDILRAAEAELARRFCIIHTTLQMESQACADDSLLCSRSPTH